jgi:hypothetical protein
MRLTGDGCVYVPGKRLSELALGSRLKCEPAADAILVRAAMDENSVVLTVFAGGLVAVIVGYVLAWRAKQTAYRKAGSLMTAVVAGFAGLFMLAWLIGAVMPLPPPDGTSIWGPLVFLLVSSPIPLGALYISARFFRRALRDERG